MPERMPGSRHFRIDRIVPSLGRLRVSSRTDKKTEFDRRNGLITKLVEVGHLETLRLLRNGVITIEELVSADRNGTLLRVTEDVLTYRPLLPTFLEWIEEHRIAAKTRKDYKNHFRRFVALAMQLRQLRVEPRTVEIQDFTQWSQTKAPAIADLERVEWAKIRKHWKGTEFDWSNLRICLASFLGNALNKGLDRFRDRVMQRVPTAKLPKNKKRVLHPDEFWTILGHVNEVCKASYMAMAVLGVGPDEYLRLQREDLDPEHLRVRVWGTKNRYRERYVRVDPRLWTWIDAAIPSPLKYRWLGIYWKRAVEAAKVKPVRMYDLRHLSGQAASEAGVTVQDIATHMGHSDLETTMWYLQGRKAATAARGVADTLLNARPDDFPATQEHPVRTKTPSDG